MEKQKWIEENGIYFPSFERKLINKLDLGIYQIVELDSPFGNKIGLKYLGERFEFPYKIYSLGTNYIESRIVTTWNSTEYIKSGKNLGVIYNGKKGAGKTVAAKVLCNKLNLPVIVVAEYMDGLLEFIQSLDFECVVLIDEAEKIFDSDDNEKDQLLLKVIDGVYNASRKLYILTTNTLSLNDNLLSRPSRIRYIKHFNGIPIEAVDELIEEKLTDSSKAPQLKDFISHKCTSLTIDIVENLITEVNIHGDLPKEGVLNINSHNLGKLMIGFSSDTGIELNIDKMKGILNYIKYTLGISELSVVGSRYSISELNEICKDDKGRVIYDLVEKSDDCINDTEDLVYFLASEFLGVKWKGVHTKDLDIIWRVFDFWEDKVAPKSVDACNIIEILEVYDRIEPNLSIVKFRYLSETLKDVCWGFMLDA